MLRELWNKLMGKPKSPPAIPGLIVPPTNIPVPAQPANDPTPIHVPLMTTRDVLRFSRNDTLVLPGSTVVTRNNAQMKVARVAQKPPYVICVYRGRRLAVRPDNIGCYWTTVVDRVDQIAQ